MSIRLVFPQSRRAFPGTAHFSLTILAGTDHSILLGKVVGSLVWDPSKAWMGLAVITSTASVTRNVSQVFLPSFSFYLF